MIKEILNLYRTYTYFQLVIKNLPKKERYKRLWIFIYLLPMLFIFLVLSANAEEHITLKLLVCGLYLIDINLSKLKMGLYHSLYSHCLKAELLYLNVKSKEDLIKKFNKLRTEFVVNKFKKSNPNVSKSEIISILEKVTDITSIFNFTNLFSIISIILTLLSMYPLDNIIQNFKLKELVFLSVLILLLVIVILILIFPIIYLLNRNSRDSKELIELIYKSNW